MEPAAMTVKSVVQSVSEEEVSLACREMIFRVKFDKITHESGKFASSSTVHCGDLAEVQLYYFQAQSVVVKEAIKKELERDNDKRVYTASVLKIESLVEIYKSSSLSQLLKVRFSAWRQLNPSIGRDIWAALAVGYVEYLLREETKEEIVTNFARKLSQFAGEPLTAALRGLQEYKNKGKHWVQLMAAKCISFTFWESLGTAVKLYCSETFANDRQMQQRQNSNAVEVPFVIFASVFNVTVVAYQTNNYPWKLKYQPIASDEIPSTSLYFLRDNQSYHILYFESQLKDFDIAAMRVRVERWETEEIDFTGFAEFFVVVQRYITAVIETVSAEECRKLFTPQLVLKLRLMFEKLQNSLSNPQLSSFQDFIPSVSTISSQLFGKLVICGLVCSVCRNNSPDVDLLCGHPVCKFCFQQYIDSLLASDPSFLSPSGSLCSPLHCVEATCQFPITTSIFRTYADTEKLEATMKTMREHKRLQKCETCGYWLSGDYFFSSCVTCPSPICDICYCERIRSNKTTCFCGEEFSMEVKSYVEEIAMNCAVCSENRNLLADFENRKCEFHMICLTCGVGAKSCPLCEPQEFLPQ